MWRRRGLWRLHVATATMEALCGGGGGDGGDNGGGSFGVETFDNGDGCATSHFSSSLSLSLFV